MMIDGCRWSLLAVTWVLLRDCRQNGTCHQCPNTAWLLFLMFSLALVAIVTLAVYLSKKRLNLAAMGIGIVRIAACRVLACHSLINSRGGVVTRHPTLAPSFLLKCCVHTCAVCFVVLLVMV